MFPLLLAVLLGKKAKLSDPCYHKSELFFQTPESSGFQGLSGVCHLGLPVFFFFNVLTVSPNPELFRIVTFFFLKNVLFLILLYLLN
jgi:hypothetical protein